MNQSPAIHAAPGSRPVANAYGVAATLGKTYVELAGAKPAGAGWNDYEGRGNLCFANNDTCLARRVAGEMLCIGHLRSLRKMQAETSAPVDTDEVVDESV